MTTLSNLDLVAEFGWTIQIIKNSTVSFFGVFRSHDKSSYRRDSQGGRLPRYWRPPYGDTDNRVRAIAKEIFGLQTIIWNHEWGHILLDLAVQAAHPFLAHLIGL